MKSMMKLVAATVLLILTIATSVSAQCISSLGDESGSTFEVSLVNDEACRLIDSLPAEFQGDFGVFDMGYYIQTENQSSGLYSEHFESAKTTASNVKGYFLLIARESNTTSTNNNIVVALNLPSTGIFSCHSDGDEQMLRTQLEEILNGSGSLESRYSDAIDHLIDFVEELKNCCIPGFKKSTSCNKCHTEDEAFGNHLRAYGMSSLDANVSATPYTSTSNVTVHGSYKVTSGQYANIVSDFENIAALVPGKNVHGYILDRSNVCSGKLDEILTSDGEDVALIAVVYEDANGTGHVNFLGKGCIKSHSLFGPIPASVFLPDPEWRLKVNGEAATMKMLDIKEGNTIKSNHSYWWAAFYKVCFSEPLHWSLSAAGVVVDVADLFDAGLYALEGDYTSAAWSTIAVIPVFGTPIKCVMKVTTSAAGNKVYLVYKYVNGKINFGASTQLVTVLGSQAGKAAHHVIPWELFTRYEPAIKRLVEKCNFHPNNILNGKHVWKKINGSSFHNGSHPKYTAYVKKKIDDLSRDNPGNTEYLQAVESFISNLKVDIDNISNHVDGLGIKMTFDAAFQKCIILRNCGP